MPQDEEMLLSYLLAVPHHPSWPQCYPPSCLGLLRLWWLKSRWQAVRLVLAYTPCQCSRCIKLTCWKRWSREKIFRITTFRAASGKHPASTFWFVCQRCKNSCGQISGGQETSTGSSYRKVQKTERRHSYGGTPGWSLLEMWWSWWLSLTAGRLRSRSPDKKEL